jgi:hypothetical protein
MKKLVAGCGTGKGFIIVGLAVIPLAGLALVALVSMASTLREHYLRGLEEELRRQIGLSRYGDSGRTIATLPADRKYVMVWTELVSTMHRSGGQFVYQLIVGGLIFGITAIYAALLVVIGLRVDRWPAAFLVGFYTFSAMLLVGAILKTSIGSHALWGEVTYDFAHSNDRYRRRRHWSGALGRLRRRRRRTLFGYLVFPRSGAFVLGLVLVLGATFFLWQAFDMKQHTTAGSVAVAIVACMFFEWGFVAAHDQWADIRRQEYLPSEAPGVTQRVNIVTSVAVLLARVAVPFAWIAIFTVTSLSTAAIIAGAVAGSALFDAVADAHDRRKRRDELNRSPESPAREFVRGAPSRILEIIAVGVVFGARAAVGWRTAKHLGVHVPTWAWLGTMLVLTVIGVSWIYAHQLVEARYKGRAAPPIGRFRGALARAATWLARRERWLQLCFEQRRRDGGAALNEFFGGLSSAEGEELGAKPRAAPTTGLSSVKNRTHASQ